MNTGCKWGFALLGILLYIVSLELYLEVETDTHSSQYLSGNLEKSNVFAKAELVSINTQDYGTWDKDTKSGLESWKYQINTEAASLNFGFSEFVLPPSAKLLICDSSNKNCQEFLPRSTDLHHLEMWTPILKGNVANFTLTLDSAEKNLLKFRINTVNKGFKRESRSATNSGCLIDVLCTEDFPQIEDWSREIRSVGMISIEGTRLCTGVLLNNVRQDFTPYFLTARHCGINSQNAESVVVHWNFENSVCRFGQDSNTEEGDGKLMTFNSGATLLAQLQRSDFTLLQLNEDVVPEAEAFFAGWSAIDVAPKDVTTIHHANTEEKRITFGNGDTEITRHFGFEENPELDHIRVLDWDISSTSGGSSGGPLFDANHRVVGQLHGGLAACENEESDWFGRFYTSWEGDSIPERQLKHWLDPDDTGISEIDGIEAELEPLSLQISISELTEVICHGDSTASIQINIANGAGPFRYSIDGGKNFQSQNVFQNLGAGFYSVLVVDAENTTSAIVPVFVNEPDPIVLDFDQLYNQITLNVDGGNPPYLFSHNGDITFDSTFSNLRLGINRFRVIDSKACSTDLEVDLAFDEFQSQLIVMQEIQCADSQNGIIAIQHSGTVAPYTYQLNNSDLGTQNVFEDLGPGNYIGRVIDSLGNTVETNSITLEAPPILEAELIQIEENVEVSVSGGVAPYIFSYDDGDFVKTNQFQVNEPVQTVSIMDANGCRLEIENFITSTKENYIAQSIFLFPNPSNERLSLSSSEALKEYQIINIHGLTVQKGNFSTKNDQLHALNLTDLESGMYFMLVRLINGESELLKFTKI